MLNFIVHGECLAPAVPNGAMCTFDRRKTPRSGDIVCVQMLFAPFAAGMKYLEHRPPHGWWFASTDGMPPIKYNPAHHVIVAPMTRMVRPSAIPEHATAQIQLDADLEEFRAELAALAREALQVPVELDTPFVDTRTPEEVAAVRRVLLP